MSDTTETATADETPEAAPAAAKSAKTPATPAGPVLPDVSSMTYEQARDALVETVAKLESGRADLETSVALWEHGEALAAHCTAALDRAEARLDALGEDAADED